MGTNAFGLFDLDAMVDGDVLAAVEEMGIAAFGCALMLCTFDDRRLRHLVGEERWSTLAGIRRGRVRSSDAIAAVATLREYDGQARS
jgi:hypothetical protein